jgi:hypothetical protein
VDCDRSEGGAKAGAGSEDRVCDAMREAHVGPGGSAGGAAGTARVAARLRQQADLTRGLKLRLDSIRLTANGVVPLDLACSSSREAQALMGPADAAYMRSGIIVATAVGDGSQRRSPAFSQHSGI